MFPKRHFNSLEQSEKIHIVISSRLAYKVICFLFMHVCHIFDVVNQAVPVIIRFKQYL